MVAVEVLVLALIFGFLLWCGLGGRKMDKMLSEVYRKENDEKRVSSRERDVVRAGLACRAAACQPAPLSILTHGGWCAGLGAALNRNIDQPVASRESETGINPTRRGSGHDTLMVDSAGDVAGHSQLSPS